MFSKTISIFRLFGFEVKIDLSWLILAVLIAWSLATGVFPAYFEGLSKQTYWWMAIAGTLGLFFSIVLHELSHSLVARRYGLPIKGITLFMFGGVAEMEDEPDSPKVELLMAAAGPGSSILLAGVFFGLQALGAGAGWPRPVVGVLGYMAYLNGLLAIFNLLPAFPLDGGRVLRAVLWKWKKSMHAATRIASKIGAGFGIALIVLGAFSVIQGDWIGGMWWFLIGMFLRQAANSSYQRLIIRRALEGEPVRRFMTDTPVTVPPDTTLRKLLEDYIFKHHFKMLPVAEGPRLVGCIDIEQLKKVPRNEWSQKTVGEVVGQCSAENAVSPETDAVDALSIMNRTNQSRLMVVDDGKLVGVIALKDLMAFLSLKMELDPPDES